MTDSAQPGLGMDELLARHEGSGAQPEDIVDVAKLFNQVGSSLSSIDKQNVDGSPKAMKLDKNSVLELQSGRKHAPVPPSPPPVPPVAPVLPVMPHQPVHHSANNITEPTVTVDHKTYEQHVKKLSTVTRKLNKIEKELVNIRTINKTNISPSKYKVTTSDGVELVGTDPALLLSVISSQLDKKAKEIIITKC